MLTIVGNSYPVLVDIRPQDVGRSREEAMRQRDQALIKQARDHFRAVSQAEGKWRARAIEDMRFRAGEQWDTTVLAQRQQRGQERPCLTLNLFPKFIHQIVNEVRQNPVAMKALPADGSADVKTARVFQGLMRAIENASDADVAYETALDHAATWGKGYWRILAEYSDPWSFEQELRIKRVLNPFSVYLDYSARIDPDYHTARYGMVVERMPKDLICDTYQVSHMDYRGWESQGDTWVYRDEVQVADYYYTHEHLFHLYRLPGGEMRYVPIMDEPLPQDVDAQEEALVDQGWQVIQMRLAQQGVIPLNPEEQGVIEDRQTRTRQSSYPIIRWLKIVGNMVVERTFWPGRTIPIVPVLGEEVLMHDEVDYRGVVRDAQDAQRMYNYGRSAAVEAIALAPKAPFIGTPQQFEGFEEQWEHANTEAFSALFYNPHVVGGQVLPPPQRVQAEPQIQAVSQFALASQDDVHQVVGIYPPALGDQSNEVSGVAIRRREGQSQAGAAHYPLNLQRAIRSTARQLVDLIPAIYPEPGRVVRIIGEDGSEEFVALHPQAKEAGAQAQLPEGIAGVYALGAGKYDVRTNAGPAYQTRREETAGKLIEMAGAIPQVAQVMPDLIVGTQDFDEVDEAVRRLRATLPPGVLGDDLSEQKPEVQVQMLLNKVNALTEEAKALNAYAQQREAQAEEALQGFKQVELQLANKQGELDVKVREALSERAFEQEKLRLEWAKLEFERQKFALEHQARRMEMEHEAEAEVATDDDPSQ